MRLCVLQGVSSDITDLEILVGRGRGVVVVHRTQHLFVVQNINERKNINILHFKDLFLFNVKSTQLCECSNL